MSLKPMNDQQLDSEAKYEINKFKKNIEKKQGKKILWNIIKSIALPMIILVVKVMAIAIILVVLIALFSSLLTGDGNIDGKAENAEASITTSSLEKYLQQFSHSGEAPKSADGKFYKMYSDGKYPTIGNADIKWSTWQSKFACSGVVLTADGQIKKVEDVQKYVNGFLSRGDVGIYSKEEINMLNIFIEKELVDNIGQEIRDYFYNKVVSETNEKGLNLSQQQLYALTTICYNRGNIKLTINGRTTTFLEVYNRASSLYSVNSWEHNRYIWDNWWSYSTKGDRSRSRDASFETYVKGYYDLAQSRGGGVFARTCYVYWTQEQLNRLDSPKNLPVTRTAENEQEIFSYNENTGEGTGSATFEGQTLNVPSYTSTTSGRTFLLYKQANQPWSNLQAGYDSKTKEPGTIAKRGCLITAMASIMTGYGVKVTPGDLSYSSHGINTASTFSKYGLKATFVSKNEIRNSLRQGYQVLIDVRTRAIYKKPT